MYFAYLIAENLGSIVIATLSFWLLVAPTRWYVKVVAGILSVVLALAVIGTLTGLAENAARDTLFVVTGASLLGIGLGVLHRRKRK